ncbi:MULTISPECIES: lytic transglycosylase domain-containing protein [Pseudothermotoga]|uniref:Lytic transglycosylase catalytic n=1 Tax=Pseudothermotoga lettingae (strain ATCC BAA-301 / DSM 14385 / NBRC 107922 / TMO) TaxID=416591 RepID=A8F349_PSELT|nr:MULTISPECIES: lytic transglycosylase domain-containing protein [Pseudothermotoga]ABV32579.1 Lytic transglycosylase catalytic [Pseudothermotoga lettingae TMO]KUK20364.1 MAG: Lytic transglycosylase catalytic [Pseudothermotoga lettingae]GLI48435.1 lytic transglycosylase [Pseudothermotoga lettingae TMO]HBJ80840.1 lytic transglycosylase domain-containing protein [Pseudothermotoga sp.]HBT26355.1 lytic transglycosylase domain-containing protein [Pseudothermotoga sp.]
MKLICLTLFLIIIVLFYWQFPVKYYSVVRENSKPLDPLLIMALIKVESNFRENAISPAGAIGLMQVMPRTADWMKEKFNLIDSNVNHPVDNIVLGTTYLKYLMQLYDENIDLALMAYNVGPSQLETRKTLAEKYLYRIKLYYKIYKVLYFWMG